MSVHNPIVLSDRQDKIGDALRASVAILRPKRIRYATPHDVGYVPKGGALELFGRNEREQEIVLDGPAGCVSGETRIYNPITGEHTEIQELHRNGIAPVVLTLNGPVLAEVPFIKGRADLYRVTLSSGRSCLVTMDHRVLRQDGWRHVSSISVGEQILISLPSPPMSIAEPDRRVSRKDAPHYCRRQPSLMGRCLSLVLVCGAQLQTAEDSAQERAPLRGDVRAYTRDDQRSGDPVLSREHSRRHQCDDLRATLDCSPLSDGTALCRCRDLSENAIRVVDSFRRDQLSLIETRHQQPCDESRLDLSSTLRTHATALAGRCSCEARSSPDALTHRSLSPLPSLPAYADNSRQSIALVPPLTTLCPCATSAQKYTLTAQWDTVLSIEYERTDWYYDLHVPGEEHYLAEGIWHHNTGKTLALLWRFHLLLHNFPNSRALIVRKTHASLTASALETFRRYVLARESFGAYFYGGSKEEPPQYRYPNGSAFVIGGLDNSAKVMSSEYDGIVVNEATEIQEGQWEDLMARRRLGVWPVQILAGDCNPQAPTHWLNQRMNRTPGMRILSRYEDNPRYWDAARGDWTPEGRSYVLNTLGRLTGVRLQRLRYGKWVSAEGQIYETFSEGKHVVTLDDPVHGPRIANARYHIGAGDWGWNNPGVLGVIAVTGDGDAYLVAEVYRTEEHVDSWWVDVAKELQDEYGVIEWVFDPSEPQYIEKMDAAGLRAEKANNAVKPGIDAVSARLSYDDDHEPRLYFVADALRYQDEKLIEKRKPFSTTQEMGEYVWAKDRNGVTLDKPAPGNDHGMDMIRYGIARIDLDGVSEYVAPDAIDTGTMFTLAGDDRMPSEWDSPWDQ